MENYTRIYLEGFGDIQLYDNVPVSLNYSVAEIQDISKKNSSFSKTINIPGTKQNNELLGNLFSISISDSSFDVNRKVACKIYGADVVLMKGYFRLMAINKISENSTDGEELIEYEALVFDQTTDFYDKLSDTLLEDLDFSQYDHIYGYSSIIGTSAHTADDIYTYPMLYNNNTTFYSTKDFHPAIYLKAYLDKAFQFTQYSYESDFLNSDYFKSLIIPFNGEKSYNSQATINARKFQVGMTGVTDSVSFSGAQSALTSSFSGYTLPFNSDNNTVIPYFDSGNTYNVSTYRYTSDANQTLDFRFRINATTNAYNPFNQQLKIYTNTGSASPFSAKINVRAYLYKNGVLASTSSVLLTHNIGNTISATATTTSQTTTLDYTFSNVVAGFNDQFELRVKPIVSMPAATNWRIGPGFGSSVAYSPIINLSLDVSQSGQTSGNNFYINAPHIGEISDFDTVELNNFIPRNIKIKDLFSSVLKMFNLYVEQDSDFENKLIIKTREEYYSSNTYSDWTQKMAIDKDMNIKFIPELQNKDLILTYKQDSDELNKAYFDQTKEVYGQKKYVFDNDFLSGEKKIELIFSPTPLVKNGFGLTVPGILSQSPKNNIRILYKPDSWLSQTGLTWTYRYQTSGGTYQYATFPIYPYAGHFDKPQFPTEDINFGQTQSLFYSDYGNITDNNLSSKYYFNQVDQMLEGRLFTAYFDLDYTDILNLKFSDKVFIKDSYFIINKIQDFDPITKSLTKVELLKVEEGLKFATTNRIPVKPALEGGVFLNTGTTVGTVVPTRPITSGELLSKNDPYLTNSGSIVLGLTTNNVVNSKTAIVSGEENYVEQNTKAIIVGDSNTADGGSKTMIIGTGNTASSDSSNIIIGNDSVIPSGVDSAVIFGDSITATTNNTFYTNNIVLSDGGTINGYTVNQIVSGATSGSFLPLSGGVMTGAFTAQTIEIADTYRIQNASGSYLDFYDGTQTYLYGNNPLLLGSSDLPNAIYISDAIDVDGPMYFSNALGGVLSTRNKTLLSINTNVTNSGNVRIGSGVNLLQLKTLLNTGTSIANLSINADGYVITSSTLSNVFLPLSGGLMTGDIVFDVGTTLKSNADGSAIDLGDGLNTIELYGDISNPSNAYIKLDGDAKEITFDTQNIYFNPINRIGINVSSGGYQFPLADGTAGQVLTTDGLGVLTFTDVSGATTTKVQPGSNITTGGTATNPVVNLVASPSVNNLTLSGTGTANIITATTISANTVSIQSSGLKIRNPANTFSNIFASSAIAANRTITIPLLTSNDTLVTAAFSQTLTNKTLTSPVINTQITGNVTNGTINTTNRLVGETATQTLSNKTAVTFSGGTLSGGTIFSGSTNLYSIFAPLGNAFTGGTVAGATTFTQSVTMNEDLTVDDLYQTSHYQTQTTDATITTLATIATTSENVYQIEANICAGINDTSAGYTSKVIGSFKNNGGTLTQIGKLNFIENIDSALTTPGTVMTISGQNVLVRVSGQTSTTIDWGCSLIIHRMPMGVI